ncbi:MAG: hypothetical protein ABIO46_10990 [Chitinophagales bacterium]
MNKEIYLLQGVDAESYQDFRQRIFAAVTQVNSTFNPDSIKFTITEKAPPRISIIPFSKKKMAAISVYNMNADEAAALKSIAGFRGAYKVEEALPVSYHKNWRDGEPTPGVCLLTLFSKKKNIDDATFLHRWHNGHTPLSLKIHPLWNYVRNEVKEIITLHAPEFNGIVEEQMRTTIDLLNPFKFFGNPLIIIPRMLTVYTDTKSFIDYSSMETYLAAEYHVKSK